MRHIIKRMPEKIKVAFIKTDVLKQSQVDSYASADILIILTKDASFVSIKDELSGKSERLLTLGRLTKDVKGLCFVGLKTDNYGCEHKSVAVFYKGRLIRLADQSKSGDKSFSPSCGYKTVSYSGFKIGVAVGKDLIDADCLNCFSLCDCDVIINLSGDFYDFSTENLVSALSYLYGVTVVSVSADKSAAATCGKTVFSTFISNMEKDIAIKKTYRVVTVKKRGNT